MSGVTLGRSGTGRAAPCAASGREGLVATAGLVALHGAAQETHVQELSQLREVATDGSLERQKKGILVTSCNRVRLEVMRVKITFAV